MRAVYQQHRVVGARDAGSPRCGNLGKQELRQVRAESPREREPGGDEQGAVGRNREPGGGGQAAAGCSAEPRGAGAVALPRGAG